MSALQCLQKMGRNATLLAALAVPASAWAIEAGGVRFEDKISLGGKDLIANGAGVRSKFVFDVYAMALYLPVRTSAADAVTSQNGTRRIALQLMRDVSADDFVAALKTGMQANLPEAEYATLKPQIQQFAETLIAIKEVKKGTAVLIDFFPGTGTRVSINGQPQGKEIAGDAFYNALLKIWLGNNPVQDDLKSKLMGR